ncbi:uncharacterized protein TRIADDRAFT_58917 [Trichoplax adhaerens]|uniref:EF-hand domain-containing protein n=1 Tax=Trichoplax adhaerens TaxID=10228 RepID=B3S413_TRIAD|nr:predicted protein [Trichoplax adhaerens]EDV22378.1 predicted protein [Trichoplax adhaerens]|eukprot:XP_002114922.1 predicted protein [Trichoplax adhaerens]
MALPAIIDRKATNINPLDHLKKEHNFKNQEKEFRLPKLKNDANQLKDLHQNFPYQLSRKRQLIEENQSSIRRPDGTVGINSNFRPPVKKPFHLNPLTRSIENVYDPKQDDGQLRPSHHKLSKSVDTLNQLEEEKHAGNGGHIYITEDDLIWLPDIPEVPDTIRPMLEQLYHPPTEDKKVQYMPIVAQPPMDNKSIHNHEKREPNRPIASLCKGCIRLETQELRFPRAIRTGGGYIIFNQQLRDILSNFNPDDEGSIPPRLRFVELPERDYSKILPGYLLKDHVPITPVHKNSTRPESPKWTPHNPLPWPAPVWPKVKKKPTTKFIDQRISLVADKRMKEKKLKKEKNKDKAVGKIYCIPLVKLDPKLKKSLRITDSRGNHISNNKFTIVQSMDDIKNTTIAHYTKLGNQHTGSFGLQRSKPAIKIDVITSHATEVGYIPTIVPPNTVLDNPEDEYIPVPVEDFDHLSIYNEPAKLEDKAAEVKREILASRLEQSNLDDVNDLSQEDNYNSDHSNKDHAYSRKPQKSITINTTSSSVPYSLPHANIDVMKSDEEDKNETTENVVADIVDSNEESYTIVNPQEEEEEEMLTMEEDDGHDDEVIEGQKGHKMMKIRKLKQKGLALHEDRSNAHITNVPASNQHPESNMKSSLLLAEKEENSASIVVAQPAEDALTATPTSELWYPDEARAPSATNLAGQIYRLDDGSVTPNSALSIATNSRMQQVYSSTDAHPSQLGDQTNDNLGFMIGGKHITTQQAREDISIGQQVELTKQSHHEVMDELKRVILRKNNPNELNKRSLNPLMQVGRSRAKSQIAAPKSVAKDEIKNIPSDKSDDDDNNDDENITKSVKNPPQESKDVENSNDAPAASGGFLAPPRLQIGIKTVNPVIVAQKVDGIKIAKPTFRQRSYTINPSTDSAEHRKRNDDTDTHSLSSTQTGKNQSKDDGHVEENSLPLDLTGAIGGGVYLTYKPVNNNALRRDEYVAALDKRQGVERRIMERQKNRRIKRTIKRTNEKGEEEIVVVEEEVEVEEEEEEEFFVDEDDPVLRENSPTDVDLTEELLHGEYIDNPDHNHAHETDDSMLKSDQDALVHDENNLEESHSASDGQSLHMEKDTNNQGRSISIKKPNKIIPKNGPSENQTVNRPEAPTMQNVPKIEAPQTPEPIPDVELIGKLSTTNSLANDTTTETKGLSLGVSPISRQNPLSRGKNKVQNIRKPNAGRSLKEPPLVPLIDPLSFKVSSSEVLTDEDTDDLLADSDDDEDRNPLGEGLYSFTAAQLDETVDIQDTATAPDYKKDEDFVGNLFPFDAEIFFRRGGDLFESKCNSRNESRQEGEIDETETTIPDVDISDIPKVAIEAPDMPAIAPPPVPTFSDDKPNIDRSKWLGFRRKEIQSQAPEKKQLKKKKKKVIIKASFQRNRQNHTPDSETNQLGLDDDEDDYYDRFYSPKMISPINFDALDYLSKYSVLSKDKIIQYSSVYNKIIQDDKEDQGEKMKTIEEPEVEEDDTMEKNGKVVDNDEEKSSPVITSSPQKSPKKTVSAMPTRLHLGLTGSEIRGMTPAQLLDRLDPEGTMAALNQQPQLTITGRHAVTKGSLQERELLLDKLRQVMSTNVSPASSNDSDLSIGEIEGMLSAIPRTDSKSIQFRNNMKEVRDLLHKTRGDLSVLNDADFKSAASILSSSGRDHHLSNVSSSNKVDSTTTTPLASRGAGGMAMDGESAHLRLPIIEEPDEAARPDFLQHRSQPNSASDGPTKILRQHSNYISEFDQRESYQPRRRAMTETRHVSTAGSAGGRKESKYLTSHSRGRGRDGKFHKSLTLKQLGSALKTVNRNLISEKEIDFVKQILDLPGRKKLNFKLFTLVAALSEKVVALDGVVKNMINKLTFDALDVKLQKCKELFYLLDEDNFNRPSGVVTLDNLAIELAAGGLSHDQVRLVRKQFDKNNVGTVEFIDYLTYIPLFMEIHSHIISEPLKETQKTQTTVPLEKV